MPRLSIEDIAELSVAERVQLAEDIWDSIAANPESLPITEAQRLELDRRLSMLEADPARTRPCLRCAASSTRGGDPSPRVYPGGGS
ncbi:MAG TPA: addiction module protein [Myxococcota bacterium]|nr:addiction module protein [Myxococcota bacterium]